MRFRAMLDYSNTLLLTLPGKHVGQFLRGWLFTSRLLHMKVQTRSSLIRPSTRAFGTFCILDFRLTGDI